MPVKIVCEKTGKLVTFKFVKGASRMKCPSCGFGHFLAEDIINVPPGREVEAPQIRSEPVSIEGAKNDPARGILHREWLLPDRGALDGAKLGRLVHHALENARSECDWLADWKLAGRATAASWPSPRRRSSRRVARFRYLCGAGRGARTDVIVLSDPQAGKGRKLRVEATVRPDSRLSRITRWLNVLLLLAALGIWGFIGYHYAMSSKEGSIVAPSFSAEWASHVPEMVPEKAREHVAAGVAAVAPLLVMVLLTSVVGIVTRISGFHELGPIESHSISDAFAPAFEEMLVMGWSEGSGAG